VLAEVDSDNLETEPCNTIDYLFMFAYGKFQLKKWKEFARNQDITINSVKELNYFLGCLMLSALNEKRVLAASLAPAPLDLVRKLASNVNTHYQNLCLFLMHLSREELVGLSRMKIEDPVLLSDCPCIWEVLFHEDKGLAKVNRQKTMKVLNKCGVLETIVAELLKSSYAYSQFPEGELKRVLLMEGLREKSAEEAMSDILVVTDIVTRARDLWLKDAEELGKKYIMGVLQVYLKISKGEFGSWADRLAEKVPVQLLVVAEEKVRSGGGQKWVNILKRVQIVLKRYSSYFQDKLTLNNILDYGRKGHQYNRECDWYLILEIMLNNSNFDEVKTPVNYATRTKLYPTWECSLLRVWIQLFGEEETRKQADEKFWETASLEMYDGELLHIAVEIHSLVGVRWSAKPKTVIWRDGNGKIAMEVAEDKLGKDHEVTKCLVKVMGDM